jgi:GntR family transcriptional regulator/MocR family aminotransferase
MHLNEEADVPLYQQLFDTVRRDIEQGNYKKNDKLPSIRSLAADLGCSRNTVETAYSLLCQEGYIESRPGSGYTVQDISLLTLTAPLQGTPLQGAPSTTHLQAASAPAPASAEATSSAQSAPPKLRYDFTYGDLEPGTFPATAWRTIIDDILLSIENTGCDAYNNPLGEPELREAIAWRLTTQRGIACSANNIVIQGGTTTSVLNLLTLFNPTTDIVAFENPGYDGVRKIIQRAHFKIAPCRVTTRSEFLHDLNNSQAKLAYLTPSSQFPTCHILSKENRMHTLSWAIANNAYILEDDYCRDFRYRDRSLPPLASMDIQGRVIYMGTFSKSLSPALRINYLMLPDQLIEPWNKFFGDLYSPVPWLNQIALARLMKGGVWDRHLRRLQLKNRRKYELLMNTLKETMGSRVSILENGTGLHVLLQVPGSRSQYELIDAAAEAGVAVYPTSKYWFKGVSTWDNVVLMGFSSIAEEDIEPGIKALAKAWFGKG